MNSKRNGSFFNKIFFFLSFIFLTTAGVFPALARDCIQGKGSAEKETRKIGIFEIVNVDGAFSVVITCGQQRNLEITAEKNILPHIVTTVKEKALNIYPECSVCSRKGIIIKISIEDLKKVYASGANDIRITGIDNREFALEMGGAGDTTVSGKSSHFTADVTGAGSLKAGSFHCLDVWVSIRGACNAIVHASRKLAAEISGAGDICYGGSPGEVVKSVAGAGNIRHCAE